MPRTFGAYTPERAEETKDSLDHRLSLIEMQVRLIGETVPGAGGITQRNAEALDIIQGVVSDLQGEIDRRTDGGGS